MFTVVGAVFNTTPTLQTFKGATMNIRKMNVPSDAQSVCLVWSDAFAGAPWFETLDPHTLMVRLTAQSHSPGFVGVVAISDEGKVMGASWGSQTTVAGLMNDHNTEVAAFAEGIGSPRVMWVHETVVASMFQGQGVATRLRKYWLQLQPVNTLILTRHRSDNPGIIASSKALGYKPSGCSTPSKSNHNAVHQYWYLVTGKE